MSRVVFDEDQGGYRLGPLLASFPPTSHLASEGRLAMSMARIADQLLVGVGPSSDGVGFDFDVPGSETLWSLDCRDPRRFPEPFLTHEGADFGHAAIAPDRTRLFFSHPEGLGSLELGSRLVSVIALHPGPAIEGTGEERRPVIAPIRWTDDGLLVAIGIPPTFGDGEWELTHWLVDLEDASTRSDPLRYARGLDLTVAAVGERGLLVGLTHRDAQPGDPAPLWRSADRSVNRERVELGEHAFDFVTRVAVEAERSDRASLWGWRRRGDEGETIALVSSDAGRSCIEHEPVGDEEVERESAEDEEVERRPVKDDEGDAAHLLAPLLGGDLEWLDHGPDPPRLDR